MISANQKECVSLLLGGSFIFLDFIIKNQVSENCSFSVSIYEGSPNQILLPFSSKMEANRISLSNFPAFSLTGDPGFNFRGKPIHITEVLAVSQNSLFHFSILARSSRDGNEFFSNPCN